MRTMQRCPMGRVFDIEVHSTCHFGGLLPCVGLNLCCVNPFVPCSSQQDVDNMMKYEL